MKCRQRAGLINRVCLPSHIHDYCYHISRNCNSEGTNSAFHCKGINNLLFKSAYESFGPWGFLSFCNRNGPIISRTDGRGDIWWTAGTEFPRSRIVKTPLPLFLQILSVSKRFVSTSLTHGTHVHANRSPGAHMCIFDLFLLPRRDVPDGEIPQHYDRLVNEGWKLSNTLNVFIECHNLVEEMLRLNRAWNTPWIRNLIVPI